MKNITTNFFPSKQLMQSAELLLEMQRPDHPVLCISRKVLDEQVKLFLRNFPGKVLYAVKCNPDLQVIGLLSESGIQGFDVASLPEIELAHKAAPDRQCYFNHPIKNRASIGIAYRDFGVRDFVIDSRPELEKILMEIPSGDITIQLRLNVGTGSQIYDFSAKFGLLLDDAVELSRDLSKKGLNWGLTFHVGSQCESSKAYANALSLCHQVIISTATAPKYINVGGGFPSSSELADFSCLVNFFDTIRQTAQELRLPPLICEPGRALVSRAGKLICRVVLRNGCRIYLNDGVYGAFGETNFAKIKLTAKAFNSGGAITDELQEFRVFGPTCDSFDALDRSLLLPMKITTGDWLVFDNMGAYSTSLANRFNGFSSDNICITD